MNLRKCSESFEIVTNYLSRRTTRASKKAPRILVGAFFSTFCLRRELYGNRRCAIVRTRRRAAAHFADFKTHEAADAHVLAEFNDSLANHLADGDAFVFDVVLLVEAVLFVKFFHFAIHAFFDYRVWLSGCARLGAINFALFLQHLGRYFLAPYVTRIERRDVHGDVMAKLLKNRSSSDEIRLTIDFHKHTNLAARVDVAAHQTFASFALRFFCGRSLTLFAQDADGFFDVASGFDLGRSAIG